jgi:hypothetical protein
VKNAITKQAFGGGYDTVPFKGHEMLTSGMMASYEKVRFVSWRR